ncbi:MAG: 16S rRNA (guanine(966)-N(2))-methyltransferase RsmD [Beijerinckiaceae bacterium]|nr:16S rRNA (guanine(966)-N(2))-methyltransferase RsmD [Beijerinckiaceae bacterium]MCI0736024.1 16S rRNA (guanine(966)-N(2))-methyltransferase RsmD [Beijerinckiaceae bacterium]
MRIIGGRFKGRVLKSAASDSVRPTSDRLRETIFNILAHAYGNPVEGARVIDLFAGTGAMGFEAISRGAAFALLVDNGIKAYQTIRANSNALELSGWSRVLRRDARKLATAPEGESFSLAFVDPPYGRGFVLPTLKSLRNGGWLDKDALVIVEESAGAVAALPDGFALRETRRFGTTQIVFASLI